MTTRILFDVSGECRQFTFLRERFETGVFKELLGKWERALEDAPNNCEVLRDHYAEVMRVKELMMQMADSEVREFHDRIFTSLFSLKRNASLLSSIFAEFLKGITRFASDASKRRADAAHVEELVFDDMCRCMCPAFPVSRFQDLVVELEYYGIWPVTLTVRRFRRGRLSSTETYERYIDESMEYVPFVDCTKKTERATYVTVNHFPKPGSWKRAYTNELSSYGDDSSYDSSLESIGAGASGGEGEGEGEGGGTFRSIGHVGQHLCVSGS